MRPLRILMTVLLIAEYAFADETLVVIGNGIVSKVDLATIQRLYAGRVVSLNQQAATPLNLPAGDPLRKRFLEGILGQTEEQYTGYWLVRRYVGKGAPPQEFATVDEMLRQLASMPGAVAYVPVSKVPSGANIIYRVGGK